MASQGVLAFPRRKAALGLAGVLLLTGLLVTLLISGGVPTAHADGPVLIASTGTTNPGGEVDFNGTGWSPATHYNLYVYGQSKCKPDPICAPPASATPVNAKPQPIGSDGTFGPFMFTFKATAGVTTYVFTAIATDATESASLLVQVVPAGTPPSGTPVSSSPTATPTSVATTVAASPTSASQTGGTGSQTTNTGGGNTLAIIVVTVLLLISISVLTGLLIVLPPKRRAIRAAWYGGGMGSTGGRGYGVSGPMASGPRRASGGYPPMDDPEPPAWMGGVAQWDDQARGPRSRPRPPRRPSGGDY